MNFSFLPPRPGVEPLHPGLRRLIPVAVLALAVHGAVALWPASRRVPAGAAGRVPQPGDDTPELLRLSRGLAEPSRLAPLPLAALPPPPPSSLPLALAPPPAVVASMSPAAVLPPPALPTRLSEAAAALRQLLSQAPPAALATADREAISALQRRQWWLSGAQEAALQRIWQGGAVAENAPEALGKLAEDAELRRLPAEVVPVLGTGDWHGHSLVGRQVALLLWRQAGGLWLLRLPLPSAQTLTSS